MAHPSPAPHSTVTVGGWERAHPIKGHGFDGLPEARLIAMGHPAPRGARGWARIADRDLIHARRERLFAHAAMVNAESPQNRSPSAMMPHQDEAPGGSMRDSTPAGTIGTIRTSVITCPHCGHTREEVMPEFSCAIVYACSGCGATLRPAEGDCCVYCTFGSAPCPPVQQKRQTARLQEYEAIGNRGEYRETRVETMETARRLGLPLHRTGR